MELLRFDVETYIELDRELTNLEVELNGDEIADGDAMELTGKRLTLSPERGAQADHVLPICRRLCQKINLQVCVRHADELIALVKRGNLGANDVYALRQNVKRELSCHFFIGVPAERRELFQNGRKGWEGIADAFPNATDDIEEMNKCFALCRYPAAVLHSLLVVEHGLVALGPRIGANDPKQGWDASCRQLERVVKDGYAANTTGLDFNQLEQLNVCVQAMKLAWRNKVNHASGKPHVLHQGFAPEVAEDIIRATRNFMSRLQIVLGI